MPLPTNPSIGSRTKQRWGIGARLALAFVVVVGLSSAACLVGLFLFERLSGEMQRIVQLELPRLAASTQLVQVGADINANVSLLSRAESEAEFKDLLGDGQVLLGQLSQVIASSETWGNGAELRKGADALRRNRQDLTGLAEVRFALADQLYAVVKELRWLQSDLIVEIEPLIDDARYNIERGLARSAAPETILLETSRGEALLTTLAQANLSVGLLGRFSEVSNRSRVNDALAFLDDSTNDLRRSMDTLSTWPDSITVRQLAARILELADPVTGIPALKLDELDKLEDMNGYFLAAQRTVQALGAQIAQEVSQSEVNANEASRTIRFTLVSGRMVLLLVVGLSTVVAVGVGYFYVHRNLVASIRRLADDAKNISQGKAASLALERQDELGDLADALNLFRKTRDELIQAAKLAALGQMATGIAHELNQPLSALRSHAFNGSRLIETGRHDIAKQSFAKISGLIERMSNQISHMRRFARLPDTRLTATSLFDAIDEAVALLAHRFQDEQVQLVYESESSRGVFVIADLIRLEQVLINLLSNAIDSLLTDGRRCVAIAVRTADEDVEISVSDTGMGIPIHETGHIFDPFFTTKAAGAGLGLGLSISFNIVRDFGGRLTLASTGDCGTTFVLALKQAT